MCIFVGRDISSIALLISVLCGWRLVLFMAESRGKTVKEGKSYKVRETWPSGNRLALDTLGVAAHCLDASLRPCTILTDVRDDRGSRNSERIVGEVFE